MLPRNQEILDGRQLKQLLESGMEPSFNSLAAIFRHAAITGARLAYKELIASNRINSRDTRMYVEIELSGTLSDDDKKALVDSAMDSTRNALQHAARLGYNRMYALL